MKILFVTSRYQYGDPARGEAYEHQNFLPALLRLGHDVQVFDHALRSQYTDFIALNRALLEKVETWRPQAILFVQYLYEIWTETWDILRSSGIAATANWATDDSWKYPQASRFLAPHLDAFVTTARERASDYARDGYDRVLVSQWAADAARLQAPLPSAECQYDVSFIGQRYGQRPVFIRALERAGIRVACFGHGWPRGSVAGENIAPLMRQSRISLNFSGQGYASRFLPQRRQIKARIFEVPGAGGFLLSEWAPAIDRYYRMGEEIDVFRTGEELVAKVQYYLRNPEVRDACARRASERTAQEHTYDARMRELLEFTVARHAQMPAGTGRIDWASFREALSRHTVSPLLRMLRTSLTGAARPFVGKKRAPRAARRFLFELSWRFLGQGTYAANGLPGRLFYHESNTLLKR
jgi:spore maturation protein CgeB